MKYSNLLLAALSATALTFTACGSSSSTPAPVTNTGNCDSSVIGETLPSDISSNMTLDATKVYGMDGKVNVSNNAILTIPAGTTIAGCTSDSFMVVEPGSQLIANGTQAAPITFTSQKDVKGESSANTAGEWGGLVLAGNAFTHYSGNKYEADTTVSFGSTTHANDGESSGSLQYVLIKHSGFEVETDKELNGLSLAGVGSGTTLENIAIVGGLDDGIEIWGGTANIDGLYVYNAQDDSVDTDLGYRGTISNVLVKQVNVDNTNNHDSAGMEFGNDNNTIDTDDSTATQPIIENYTAYIKGGGISLKYDAGLKATNVKFISDKAADTQQVFYRGADVVTTAAVHVDGCISFYDSAVNLADDNTTYSATNSKDSNTTANALTDWETATRAIHISDDTLVHVNDQTSCAGVTEANIWKGKAGSNDPLEQ